MLSDYFHDVLGVFIIIIPVLPQLTTIKQFGKLPSMQRYERSQLDGAADHNT